MIIPMTTLKWDERFLNLCDHVGQWSKDPSTKVGAVIVRPDRTIVSVGYNGFPRGTHDSPELYENREVKYMRVVHAEVNAVLSSNESLLGYTLYVSPLSPCPQCAALIIQTGIARVVSRKSDREDWEFRIRNSWQLFSEAGVHLDII